MRVQKMRTNLPLLRHRMNDEARDGYELALRHGARRTAIAIRAGKYSLGPALMSACREIGTTAVVEALEEVRHPMWSLCAIRYAPGITQAERTGLAQHLTDASFDQARWTLENIRHLSDGEKAVLNWVVSQR